MGYERELLFCQRILNQLNLPFLVTKGRAAVLPMVDMGLRAALGLHETELTDWTRRMRDVIRDRVICYVTDEFECSYAVLRLPEREPDTVLIVGPYMCVDVDGGWVAAFVERNGLNADWQPILENHYRRVRYLESEHLLFAALQALGEAIWGAQQYTTERLERGVPESWAPLAAPPDPKLTEDISMTLRLIESRYEAENRLMELVSQGRVQKAQMMLSRFSRGALEQRTEPTRDARNYSIILNTVMRKAAERAGVHPLYIDRVSSDFAVRIEGITHWQAMMDLWSEMARSYCLLVRKHAIGDRSPLIRKVITRIDADLTAELSLRSLAGVMNVNASYLSAQFKREMGITLTDYVSRRMEQAAYLLTTTQIPVSEVARRCGIADDNYFTKLFKRYSDKTPTQFRQEQKPGGKSQK